MEERAPTSSAETDQTTPIIELEAPALSDTRVTFNLTMPAQCQSTSTARYICESGPSCFSSPGTGPGKSQLFRHLDKLLGAPIKQVIEHIWKPQGFCNSMAKLDIVSYEYAYLKAVVLIGPHHPGLTSTIQTEKFPRKDTEGVAGLCMFRKPTDDRQRHTLLLRAGRSAAAPSHF